MATRAELSAYAPAKDFLVGIDSDGCAFDTMEIKWKECFIPRAIEHLGLQPVARYARRCLEFVNLCSATRGVNRFFGLLGALDLLGRMEPVAARGFRVPSMVKLRTWTAADPQPTNARLAELVAADPDREEASWQRFADEGMDRFLGGSYAGAYAVALLADFHAGLPEEPDFL